jgi:hypothetical protein
MRVLPEIDKRILNKMSFVSQEERQEFMRALSLFERTPQMQIYLGLFREACVFREMTYALLLEYKGKVESLEYRIEQLEEELGERRGGKK